MESLEGKKVLFIIAPTDFRDEEFEEPYRVLRDAGSEITVASAKAGTATGMFGATAQVDATLSEVDAPGYDAVLFIGGRGSAVFFDDPDAQRIAREAAGSSAVLGAICIAPVTLANAGVLEGRKVTSFDSVSQRVEKGGALYTGAGVERDGQIITADGPDSAREFGEAVAGMLSGAAGPQEE